MATIAYYIHSHYDPEDRERLEEETAQNVDDGLTPEEAWQKEAPRIPSRLRAPAPLFVPATISYDDWSSARSTNGFAKPSGPPGSNLSEWYRSLTTTATSSHSESSSTAASRPPSSSSSHKSSTIHATAPKSQERRNKNNWFIMNAIQSEPSSSGSTPAPSLAEILARDPPPLPSEGKYNPPVWLEIGPSNKGFGLLQRSGWNEGEALGPDVVRRKPVEAILIDDEIISTKTQDVRGKGKGRQKNPSTTRRIMTRQETVEVKVEDMDDVSELRQVDVIDLTMSDSDLDSDLGDGDSDSSPASQESNFKREREEGSPGGGPRAQVDHMPHLDKSPYARKALLTPITTVLKSDRLGIGLKAKTVGPHKASQKRVTHSAAALAAHVKVAEESRRRRKLFGRGKRGFEKQHRREEENRKAMMAYLKGP